jgi:glycosyltransferase involved in cell wall biosynthesis
MRIGIDGREIENGITTGIGRALSGFLSWFSRQSDSHTCTIFTTKRIDVPGSSRIVNQIAPLHATVVWDQLTLPRLLRESRADIFVSPYYKIPFLAPCPCVSWILDLMYLHYEPYRKSMSMAKRLHYRTIGWCMAHRSSMVLTCSEYSQRSIISFFHLPRERISIAPLAVAECYKPERDNKKIMAVRNKFSIAHDYILYAGNFKPHKNVEGVLAAFETVREKMPEIMLVLAGANEYGCERIRQLAKTSPFSNAVVMTGAVSLEEQVVLYSAARVLVMPSWFEGYGYPALEAMACGTPVVASSRTSVPEVVGNAGMLVDPSDPGKIAEAILAILASPERARKLSEQGLKRAKLCSEEIAGRKMLELYEKVIGETEAKCDEGQAEMKKR